MISIVVPSYGDNLALRLCLESLLCQQYQDYEVIVVNDGGDPSMEATLMAYQQASDKFRYVYMGPRTTEFRLAAGRNLGVSLARSRSRVLFIDCDLVLGPDDLVEHAKYADENTIVAGFYRHVAYSHWSTLSPERYMETFEMPSIEDPRWIEYTRRSAEPAYRSAWGGHVSYPIKTYKAIGGCYEAFTHYGYEDIDLEERAVKYGARKRLRPDLLARHLDAENRYSVWNSQEPGREARATWDASREMASPVRNGGPLLSAREKASGGPYAPITLVANCTVGFRTAVRNMQNVTQRCGDLDLVQSLVALIGCPSGDTDDGVFLSRDAYEAHFSYEDCMALFPWVSSCPHLPYGASPKQCARAAVDSIKTGYGLILSGHGEWRGRRYPISDFYDAVRTNPNAPVAIMPLLSTEQNPGLAIFGSKANLEALALAMPDDCPENWDSAVRLGMTSLNRDAHWFPPVTVRW